MNKMARTRLLISTGMVLIALFPLSACLQQGGSKIVPQQENAQEQEKIRESELRAYCPHITLPDSAAFYTVYERGGEGDAKRISYQVAIDQVTRACRYEDGQITMEVATAGRVVPGPKFTPTALTLPLYVEVRRHNELLYNKKHAHPVTINPRDGATQFLFKDSTVTFPQPTARNIRIIMGFDTTNKKSRERR